MKTCTICDIEKPLDQFHRHAHSKDGRRAACKDCRSKDRRSRNPHPSTGECILCGGPVGFSNKSGICSINAECRRVMQRQWGESNYPILVLSQTRARARKGNLPFNLKPGDIPEPPSECPCCERQIRRRMGKNNSPQLDKIIPALGYISGNIQWLCGRCNRLKGEASGDELMRLAIFVQKAESGVR